MPKFIADYDSIPLDFVRGDGAYLIDKKGRRFLDFIGGWCTATVGWKNKEMAEAITRQARIGTYVPPIFRSPQQEALAARLVEMAPGKLKRVFRCTSGSEAVEFAIKCARAATGRKTIVSIDGVYHGHTYGAMAVGDACNSKVAPCVSGFVKLGLPKTKAEASRVIRDFARLAARGDVAAFMSEPFWTNAGCHLPPDGFYKRIQDICRAAGILLVMDEVATGFRCGAIYASALQGLEPDIICLGKSFTGGYASMGATLVTEKVFRGSRGIADYSTFGWLQQDLAATAKNVEIILRDRLHMNAAKVGAHLLERLKPLEKLRKVKAVRGIGFVFGIEFTFPVAPLVALACYRKGLLVALANAHTLFFSPPLILDRKTADKGAEILEKVLGAK